MFIKSVRKDQYKDTFTPAVRILFDEIEDKQ
ncbi:MAG: cbb3-type cytochrome oxidase assembly protein [Candidatus Kapaibacterium sp.]